jgi:hypothetical protein
MATGGPPRSGVTRRGDRRPTPRRTSSPGPARPRSVLARTRPRCCGFPGHARRPGGTRPYGYRVDRDTHKLVPHPEEAPHLKEIFRLYAGERLGTRAIAAELNRRGVRNRTGKPWSGHTVARILANPAYAGDIAYGDAYVEDAHDPLIDRETWQRASPIAAERADPQTQRAASNGDYDLTGKITCPGCGHKYIGTSATGRSRTYRYYTCFSRVRYGPHGCDAARLPADDTDTAVLRALADFYTQAPGLIADAVTRARARHRDGHASRHAEAGAVLAQIKTKQAAIDRYFTAFENGTMDDTTAGPRVTALRAEVDQLQARHHEITDTIGNEPAAPPPHTIQRLGTYLHDILDAGTPAERKAAVEALIAEIRITEEGIIPVFRIPGPHSPIPGETSTSTSAVPVRAMVHSVGRLGLEPRTHGLKVRCSTIELTPRVDRTPVGTIVGKIPAFLVSQAVRLPAERRRCGPGGAAGTTQARVPRESAGGEASGQQAAQQAHQRLRPRPVGVLAGVVAPQRQAGQARPGHQRRHQVVQLGEVQPAGHEVVGGREDLLAEHVDVEVEPVPPGLPGLPGQVPGRVLARRGHPALPQLRGAEFPVQTAVLGQNGAQRVGLGPVPRAEQGEPPGTRQRRADLAGPGRRAVARDDRDGHVGGLAGGRGLAVVGVEMAIQVGQAHLAKRIAGTGERARQERAAAAHHERNPALGEHVADLEPHRPGHGPDRWPADDPGLRVPDPPDEPDREISGVGRAHRVGQAGGAQRHR